MVLTPWKNFGELWTVGKNEGGRRKGEGGKQPCECLIPTSMCPIPPSPFHKKSPANRLRLQGFLGLSSLLIRLQTASGPATDAGKIKVKPIIGGLERTHRKSNSGER
ncbi:MAG: hypothetical protein IT426_06780 [Pirellulales bacterium]|nr:hypothetical protein [Pirellulales bacterium]